MRDPGFRLSKGFGFGEYYILRVGLLEPWCNHVQEGSVTQQKSHGPTNYLNPEPHTLKPSPGIQVYK